MKRFSTILSLSLILSLFTTFTANAEFTDVSSEDSSYLAVSYVEEEGIVEGYEDETFRPEQLINRAEFTKIVIKTNFTDEEITSCDLETLEFSDLDTEAWYAPYICLAQAEGIIEGYEDNTFKANQNIIFAEAAKVILTAGKYELPEATETWYEIYTTFLTENAAYPETIASVEQEITRGEMAEIIYALGYEEEEVDSLIEDTKVNEYVNEINEVPNWTKDLGINIEGLKLDPTNTFSIEHNGIDSSENRIVTLNLSFNGDSELVEREAQKLIELYELKYVPAYFANGGMKVYVNFDILKEADQVFLDYNDYYTVTVLDDNLNIKILHKFKVPSLF